jgi:hypothetical protein
LRVAMTRQQHVPPVELYQLGFGYYVLDGHHRVAAARLLGQLEIDANVVRFDTRTRRVRSPIHRSPGHAGSSAPNRDQAATLLARACGCLGGHPRRLGAV